MNTIGTFLCNVTFNLKFLSSLMHSLLLLIIVHFNFVLNSNYLWYQFVLLSMKYVLIVHLCIVVDAYIFFLKSLIKVVKINLCQSIRWIIVHPNKLLSGDLGATKSFECRTHDIR